MDGNLKALGRWSGAIGIFAAALLLAALAQIGLGVQAVRAHYKERAIAEAVAREHFVEPPPDYPLATFVQALGTPALTVTASGEAPVTERGILARPSVLAALAGALAALGFLVAVMAWVWRAHANLVAAGMRPRYGPGKAMAVHAIPLVNLALAPDAMRELHNRSMGEPEELIDSPVDDVTAWWAATVSGVVILSLLLAKYMADIGSNLAIVTPLWMEFAMLAFAVLLLVAGAVLFWRLARIISRAQREVLPHLELEPLPAPATAPRGVRIVNPA